MSAPPAENPEASRMLLDAMRSNSECSACNLLPRGRMLQCPNGHLQCQRCSDKDRRACNRSRERVSGLCPVCQAKMDDGSGNVLYCQTAERVAALLPKECQHDGCGFTARSGEEMGDHETFCHHRPFRCFLAPETCKEQVRGRGFGRHVRERHLAGGAEGGHGGVVRSLGGTARDGSTCFSFPVSAADITSDRDLAPAVDLPVKLADYACGPLLLLLRRTAGIWHLQAFHAGEQDIGRELQAAFEMLPPRERGRPFCTGFLGPVNRVPDYIGRHPADLAGLAITDRAAAGSWCPASAALAFKVKVLRLTQEQRRDRGASPAPRRVRKVTSRLHLRHGDPDLQSFFSEKSGRLLAVEQVRELEAGREPSSSSNSSAGFADDERDMLVEDAIHAFGAGPDPTEHDVAMAAIESIRIGYE